MIISIFTHGFAAMLGALFGIFSLCIVQGGKMDNEDFDEFEEYETSFDDT